jgi:ubiquinone/menaquinone biosynthesis C-methylase UbiE
MEGRTLDAVPVEHDRFWDVYSRCYDCLYQLIPYRGLLWDTYQALDLEPGMRVLDAGCGTGNLELFISEKDHPPVTIEALDFSPEMLARAQKKCAHLDWIHFSRGNLNAPLPYEDGTFDRVVSVNVLYTLDDWDATMSELLRVLKPEGKMALTSSSPDFDGSELIRDHFRRIKNIHGWDRRAAKVLRTIGTMGTTGLANQLMNTFVIDKREKEGRYSSPDSDTLVSFFDRHRSGGVAGWDIDRSFANQNFLSTLTKAVA